MSVRTWGDRIDQAILLVDDGGGVSGRWDESSCQRLAAGPRFVIRCDVRDGAASPPHVGDVALAATGVLDQLGIRAAHLVGGDAVRFIAERYPDRVESLALVAGDGTVRGPVPTLVFHRAGDPPPPLAQHVRPVALTGTDTEVRAEIVTALLMHTSGGWDLQGDRLAARAIAAGDPTGWFDRLYRAAVAGEVDMPWDRDTPHPLLAEWARDRGIRGTGKRAIVCGCGLGADAEFLAGLGFQAVGFDIAETAVRLARERHPGSTVAYQTADLLDPPASWLRSFDLVVDVFTVQALPDPPRRTAIVNVGRLVRPGGSLVVVAYRGDAAVVDAPPWPLTPEEIDAFATDGLETVRVEEVADPRWEDSARWRVEFHRPHQPASPRCETPG